MSVIKQGNSLGKFHTTTNDHSKKTLVPFRFEAITNYLKTFSKHIKKDENMNLKNKCLLGEWILMASKVYRRENLSCRFEDWLYLETCVFLYV